MWWWMYSFIYFLLVELVIGGSVINGAYPVKFLSIPCTNRDHLAVVAWSNCQEGMTARLPLLIHLMWKIS